MWVTASRLLHKYWRELVWALFSLANLVLVVVFAYAETIPFHFVWISFALLYTIQLWRVRATVILLAAVCVTGGAALLTAVSRSEANLTEVAEVPLMAGMFIVIVWHVVRRQAADENLREVNERELRREREERELLRDASHGLRTPITVARGHAELILNAHDKEKIHQDAQIVLDELGRLARISDRLLILAAADHPGFLRRTPIEIENLVEEATRRWAAAAPRDWRAQILARGVVLADKERLEVSLDALIENAVKCTGEESTVSIVARADAGDAVIEVTDNGIGIGPANLTRIFERFSQIDDGWSRPMGGTGLGLSIVKAIVEAHDGRVTVESTLGGGATFRLHLPGFREEHRERGEQVLPVRAAAETHAVPLG